MALRISEEINKIKKRNSNVEADKAWETSKTRRIIIAFMTYTTISLFLLYIGAPDPFVASLVPTTGYVLSTLTMPVIKNRWIGRFYKKRPR